MSKFGWDYPPGCSGTPFDDAPDPHPKSEELYDLLEQAGCPQDVIDQACAIVDSLAAELQAYADSDCPACMARHEAELCPEQQPSGQEEPEIDHDALAQKSRQTCQMLHEEERLMAEKRAQQRRDQEAGR